MRKNKQGFSEVLVILIIVVLVGVVGFFVYQNNRLKNDNSQLVLDNSSTPNLDDGDSASEPTSANGLINYTFTPIGSDGTNEFSFKYPQTLELIENPLNAGFYLQDDDFKNSPTPPPESDAGVARVGYRVDFSLASLSEGETLEQVVNEKLMGLDSFIEKPKTKLSSKNYIGWEFSYNTIQPVHFYILQPTNRDVDWYLLVHDYSLIQGEGGSFENNSSLTNQIVSSLEFTK